MTHPITLDRRKLLMGTAMATTLLAGACANAQEAATVTESPDLTGTSILITGSSSGFGRLGAEYYARCGAKVFATMRNLPRPEASDLEALAASEGLDITVLEIDVTSDEEVAVGVATASDRSGGALDVLVNNAGIALAGPIELQDMAATQLIFDTNVFGAHRMIRAALPAMREAGGGQIFNVSSQLGRLVVPGYAQYSPTKFALEALSEQLAYEVASQGIEVTIIQPGGYPTDIWANQVALSADLKERVPEALLAAYPQLTANLGVDTGGGGGDTDPMDIPRAIAEIIALPAGTRPLRRAVHPIARPQEPINDVSAAQQLAMLGGSPFGPAIRAVLD
jgi:NAD(P)-dependent dehydrogenase (short-subunit alcohol dehydrogenase family)